MIRKSLKRQSTCQLEGDTTVDEILSGHQLIYTSLSQAGQEVKMVQSLIPILEEEFSRSDFHTAMEKFEDQKPPPGRVLKILFAWTGI
jgi:DNA polymerase zeta